VYWLHWDVARGVRGLEGKASAVESKRKRVGKSMLEDRGELR
jgi:hypothetical protein